MLLLLDRDGLEAPHVLGHRDLGRQPLHARGAEEADDARRCARARSAASSGSAIGPPWQRHEDVGVDRAAPRRASPGRARPPRRASCAVARRSCPPVVRPMCGTSTSAPASAIAARLVRVEDVGRGEQVELVRERGSSRPRGRSPCRSPRGPARKVPSISPTVGKFCTPVKPGAPDARRGTAASAGTGRCRRRRRAPACRATTGSTSRAMSMTIALASP